MALEGALAVEAGPDAVEFAFTVTNAGSDAIELQFTDGAKAEFIVQDAGRECWRYTEGRLFTQMLSQDRLEVGEERTYEVTWAAPVAGSFTAVAELRARDRTCEARAEFSVEPH